MALHAARPSVKNSSKDVSRLAMRLLAAAGMTIFVAAVLFVLLEPRERVGRQEDWYVGGYFDTMEYGHGYLLGYDVEAQTAIVELLPDSWVLYMSPDELGTPPEYLEGFPERCGLRPDATVALDCEYCIQLLSKATRDKLVPGVLVEVDFFLGRDYEGRYSCDKLKIVDSFEVTYFYVREYANECIAAGEVPESGDYWWRPANRIPNKNFEKNIL